MALVNTYMYGATMTEKLSKDAWLSFALNHLSNHGHTKLSANWMAAKLGVSRGSFYWHFANVQEFKTLLLKRWAALTTDEVIKDLSELGEYLLEKPTKVGFPRPFGSMTNIMQNPKFSTVLGLLISSISVI